MGELLLSLRVALAALLYLFLAIAFYILWRELQQNERRTEIQTPQAKLTVEDGAEAGLSVILRPVTTAGRAVNNQIALNDPFTSTHHAMFLWRENTWWVEDLESHNGTFLNGERIDKPTSLTSGDRIHIGQTTLRFDALDTMDTPSVDTSALTEAGENTDP